MLYWPPAPSNTFDIVLASFLNDEPYQPRNVPVAMGTPSQDERASMTTTRTTGASFG
jgi:hypothetical protein